MARALRRTTLTLSLPALVGASTLLHSIAGSRVHGLWIMPDEAIYGQRAVGIWRDLSLPILHGQGAGYSILYPLLAGGPLTTGNLSDGYALLKPVQALVMSLAAWPVYAYVRQTVGARLALLAAAATLACPTMLFSGLVMSEVLYYPLATAALLVMSRAVRTAALRDQLTTLALIGATVATRVQGVVLVPVFAAAIAIEAALSRRRPPLLRLWPVWALCTLGAVVALGLPGAFGAYASTLEGGYAVGPALRLTYYHLAYTIVMVGVVPAAALAMLVIDCARGVERDPRVRSLVSVALGATALVLVQVGVFSSRYSPHLLGRDLAALPPIMFCVFAVWLGRGARRTAVATSVIVLAVLAIVCTAPWNTLVSSKAFPDTLGIALVMDDPAGLHPAVTLTVTAAALLVLFRFVRRPFWVGVIVILLFAAGSVAAANRMARDAEAAQVTLVGTPRDWVDRSIDGPATFVYDGDTALWTVVWEQRFWNQRLDRVVSLWPHFVPGPIHQTQVPRPRDGRLPIESRYAVANDRIVLAGTPVAHQSRGPDQYGLTLWRLSRPQLVTITDGIAPNGDMSWTGTVTAFDCAGGSLQLTLLPKASSTIAVELDGDVLARANVSGLPAWRTTVHVPASHGPAPCVFRILGQALLGSTRIAFTYPSG